MGMASTSGARAIGMKASGRHASGMARDEMSLPTETAMSVSTSGARLKGMESTLGAMGRLIADSSSMARKTVKVIGAKLRTTRTAINTLANTKTTRSMGTASSHGRLARSSKAITT